MPRLRQILTIVRVYPSNPPTAAGGGQGISMSITITTAHGVQVPALGFGTSELVGTTGYHAVREALDVGYRHIDTAQQYENEDVVGRAIADSGVPRDEVFVTTKIAREHAAPADVKRTAAESLRRLGLGWVDLLLLHWPAESIAPMDATIAALDELREQGLARQIGVSNFTAAQLERAYSLAPIVTNQVEHHPYLSAHAICEVLDQHDGFLSAYCPIAQGQVADDPTLRTIAREHDVSPVQVTLRWHLQRGVAPLPRSSSPARIRENFEVFDFVLTDSQIERIDRIRRRERLIDPAHAPAWDAA